MLGKLQETSSMLKLLLLVIAGNIVGESQTIKQDPNGSEDWTQNGHKITAGDVSPLVRHIVSTYMKDCNVILMRDGNSSLIFDSILRSLRSSYIAKVLIEVNMATTADGVKERSLLDDDTFICRAILLDVTSSNDSSSALRLLEKLQLFLIPNTFVIFLGLGGTVSVEDTLMDHALRNTVNALFLAISPEEGGGTPAEPTFGDLVKHNMKHRRHQVDSSSSSNINTGLPSVALYSRCLYCNGGKDGILMADKWNTSGIFPNRLDLFPDQSRNLMGHKARIVSMDWYPLIYYTRDSNEVSTTVTPKDSFDVRILRAIADALNFTYEMRVPWDNVWGSSTTSGNWTGTVGTLQHHKADFSMFLSWTLGRNQVLDYSRVYAYDTIVMIMPKPGPLPPYLALIRPLEATLWAAVFFSTVCAGFILWVLQWGWRITSGVTGLSLDRSVLFTWSILFEEPPTVLPKNISSQMFLGWWWVYCTLITVVYKSSLIAHLSIPAMSKPIDTFDDLLKADGWTWGYEPIYDSGWEWLKTNQNPTIKNIFKEMEVLEFKEHMVRVLEGQHALISWKSRMPSVIAFHTTEKIVHNPTYVGKTEYFNYGAGWGFRKNCPMLRPISMAKQRLIETGFVRHWMNDMMGTVQKKTQNEEQPKEDTEDEANTVNPQTLHKEPEGLLVLSVHHLQGVFFVLFLGFFSAVSAFIGENLIYCYNKKSFQDNLPM